MSRFAVMGSLGVQTFDDRESAERHYNEYVARDEPVTLYRAEGGRWVFEAEHLSVKVQLAYERARLGVIDPPAQDANPAEVLADLVEKAGGEVDRSSLRTAVAALIDPAAVDPGLLEVARRLTHAVLARILVGIVTGKKPEPTGPERSEYIRQKLRDRKTRVYVEPDEAPGWWGR